MPEYEIRVYDSNDQVLKEVDSKLLTIDQKLQESRGILKCFSRMAIRSQRNKLLLEYDKRTLELGRKKPSGYHG